MASLISHLYITDKLQKEYQLDYRVLLGGILPDIEKSLKLKTKAESHYLDKKLYYFPDISLYLNQQGKVSSENLGILFHLIQDSLWYKILTNMKKINEQDSIFANMIYSDMDILDRYLINKEKIRFYNY